MQKTYCDVCKGEIDPEKDGHSFTDQSGDVFFKLDAHVEGKENGGDLCLPCTIEAVDKRARAVLGRKYRKAQVRNRTPKKADVEPKSPPDEHEEFNFHTQPVTPVQEEEPEEEPVE